MNRLAFLVTTAVSPSSKYKLDLVDEKKRLKEYKRNISQLARELGDLYDIYIVDCLNSSSLESFVVRLSPRLHFLQLSKGSLDMIRSTSEHGKGLHEAILINDAIGSMMRYRYIIKLSGRTIPRNIKKLVSMYSFYAQSTRVVGDIYWKQKFIDTRTVFFERAWWQKHYTSIVDQIDEPNAVYIEHIFFNKSFPFCCPSPVSPRYRVNARCASTGRLLSNNNVFKSLLRAVGAFAFWLLYVFTLSPIYLLSRYCFLNYKRFRCKSTP